MHRGFTLIEILTVIAIIAVLSVVSVSVFGNFRDYFALRAGVQGVQTTLLDARAATLGAQADVAHGVRVESDRVIRFRGPTYSAGASTNKVYTFPPNVTATSTLLGTGNTVLFTRLTGTTDNSGTIVITESRSGRTATLTVNTGGFVEL